MTRTFIALCVVATSIGCGSGPSSPSPTVTVAPTAPSAPTNLSIASQEAELGGSEFQLSWSGSATRWDVSIGSSPGSSDVLQTEVPTREFQWRANRAGTNTFYARVTAINDVGRSQASSELSLVSVDLKDIIDAMLFSSGPLSDAPTRSATGAAWYPWRDGTRVRIVMSSDTSNVPRTAAQRFIEQYAAMTDNAVTGVVEIIDDRLQQLTIQQVSNHTVAVRVVINPQAVGLCTLSAPGDGCNTGGPPSVGVNANIGRSVTTLGAPDADYLSHELGHAYGLWHVRIPAGARVKAMMGLRSEGLGETERRVLARARAAGLRNGSLRSQALAMGLVNP